MNQNTLFRRAGRLVVYSIIFLIVALTSSVALASQAPDQSWRFDVFLDGKPVGFHDFESSEVEGVQTVNITARFDVKVLFVTAYKYRHQNVEVWKDNCLISMTAETRDGDKNSTINARQEDDRVVVNFNEQTSTLPPCVKSFVYWRPELLDSPQLLNSQNGEHEEVSWSEIGVEPFSISSTKSSIDAVHYRITMASGDIDLWYAAADMEWLGLEAKVAGGRTLRYERKDLASLKQ